MHISDTHFQSFILLTLPNVDFRRGTSTESETGTLSVECVSPPSNVSDSTQPHKAVYLIIHHNDHIFLIDPAIPISLAISQSGERTYVFQPTGSTKEPALEVYFTVPAPIASGSTNIQDDIETFDHILSEYADFTWQGSAIPTYEQATGGAGTHLDDPALRGRLVLLDESSGEVVGQLPERLRLTEDPALASQNPVGKKEGEAGPVVLELPPDVYDAYTGQDGAKGLFVGQVEGEELVEAKEVFVRAIPPEEQDWMTTTATVISQVISSSTSLILSGLTSASTYYISRSAPYTPPDPTTTPTITKTTPPPHPALSQAPALSETAARASARTADYVGSLIGRAVGGKKSGSSSNQSSKPTSPSPWPPGSPPPLPYRPRTPNSAPSSPPRPSKTSSSSSSSSQPPTLPPRKPLRTRDRLVLSANLLLATVDDSAKRMLEVGTERIGAVVGHKYGPEAQQNANLATGTAKNVILVYIDMRGFARKALIKRAGKEWIKARVGTKDPKDVAQKT